jgi:hypothetical protein
VDKLYANSFQSVQFSELQGLPLSRVALPSAEFYAKLYEEIDRRGGGIPDEARFLTSKRQTGHILADVIKEQLGKTSGIRALSWGAGLGVIESEMSQQHGITIDAVEVRKNPRFWGENVRHFATLDAIPRTEKYDVAFTVSTLYSMDDAGVRALLADMRSRLKPGGLLILLEQDARSVLGAIKSAVASVAIHTPARHFTLWGFLRTPAQVIALVPADLKLRGSKYFGLNPDWSYSDVPAGPRLLGRQLFSRKSRMHLHAFSA